MNGFRIGGWAKALGGGLVAMLRPAAAGAEEVFPAGGGVADSGSGVVAVAQDGRSVVLVSEVEPDASLLEFGEVDPEVLKAKVLAVADGGESTVFVT